MVLQFMVLLSICKRCRRHRRQRNCVTGRDEGAARAAQCARDQRIIVFIE